MVTRVSSALSDPLRLSPMSDKSKDASGSPSAMQPKTSDSTPPQFELGLPRNESSEQAAIDATHVANVLLKLSRRAKSLTPTGARKFQPLPQYRASSVGGGSPSSEALRNRSLSEFFIFSPPGSPLIVAGIPSPKRIESPVSVSENLFSVINALKDLGSSPSSRAARDSVASASANLSSSLSPIPELTPSLPNDVATEEPETPPHFREAMVALRHIQNSGISGDMAQKYVGVYHPSLVEVLPELKNKTFPSLNEASSQPQNERINQIGIPARH